MASLWARARDFLGCVVVLAVGLTLLSRWRMARLRERDAYDSMAMAQREGDRPATQYLQDEARREAANAQKIADALRARKRQAQDRGAHWQARVIERLNRHAQ